MACSAVLLIVLATSGVTATRLHVRHGSFHRGSSSIQEAATLVTGGQPATLAAYCSGEGSDPSFKDEQRVEADWNNFGEFYPGKISKVNKNGTVDIKYDDGYAEKKVKPKNVKVVDSKEKKNKPDDAACELDDKLEDVKKKVEETERLVNLYMTTKEAQAQGVERPRPRLRKGRGKASPAPAPWFQPPPGLVPIGNSSRLAASPEPAPAPAPSKPIPKEKSKELETLREELAGLDDTIRELREEIASNDRLITGEWEGEDLDDDGTLSIDDLIQQFRDRIAERKEELEKLKARRRAQDAQLARVGASPISLGDIQVHAKEILSDVQEMEAKRDKLEKEDRLDPELGRALEDLIAEGRALDAKISAMIEAEMQAEELQKAAEAARREAVERRRKARAAAHKAREEMERRLKEEAQRRAAESQDPNKTMREAKKMAKAAEDDAIAREEAELEQQETAVAAQEAEAAAANDRALQAAKQVHSGLDTVKSGTKGMDTGVHPNGQKWWRYRYEHSFVEGLLAILVSSFVMCWESFIRNLRGWIFAASQLQEFEVDSDFAHQSLYQHWLEHFLVEMVACLLMFLTVWLVGHLGLFNQFPLYFEGHSELHLPTTGHEYRVLAYEMCVIITFALILYFCLAISVVDAATKKLARWENTEATGSRAAMTRSLTIGGEINELKDYFVKIVTLEDPEAIDVQSFSISRYLKIATRGTVDSMLTFGPLTWIAMLLTFGVFVVLHVYAHVAFIRIMTFFLAVLTATLATMVWVVVSVNRASHARVEQFAVQVTTPKIPEKQEKHQSWIIFALMTYALFFLCYGTARTLLQPWLWKLYFYPLLFVAGFSLLMCLIFVFTIAPLIPTYGASLALPPYVDVAHVKSLKETLQDDRLRS